MGAKNNEIFSLTSSILASTNAQQSSPKDMSEKPKDLVTSFELLGELRLPVSRLRHGLGKKKGTLKNVINEALAYYIANDPKAKRLANTPTPDEENDNDE